MILSLSWEGGRCLSCMIPSLPGTRVYTTVNPSQVPGCTPLLTPLRYPGGIHLLTPLRYPGGIPCCIHLSGIRVVYPAVYTPLRYPGRYPAVYTPLRYPGRCPSCCICLPVCVTGCTGLYVHRLINSLGEKGG